MAADLYVRLKMGASKNGELPRYFVENMYLSTDFVLDGTIQWLSESTVLLDECPEREGWTKLSKYLVPIFSYDDMELQVQNMLKTYLGETAVTAYQPRAAWKLAKAMELQISSAPLFKNRRTEAILFFQEGIARAERQVGDETVMEEMVIPAKPFCSIQMQSLSNAPTVTDEKFSMSAFIMNGTRCFSRCKRCTAPICGS